MTTPTVPRYEFISGTLKLMSKDVSAWIGSASLTTDRQMLSIDVLDAKYRGERPGDAKYSLDVEYQQDEQDGAISAFLWDNDGKKVAFEFVPYADSGINATYAGECYVAVGGVGGKANDLGSATAKFPVVGKPTRTMTPEA